MSSNKIIDRKIATFTTNRDKLKNLGHEIAMMIFDHANEHGDCTRAIKLAKALPNSWQPQMEAWFKAFSPIRVVIQNNKCGFDPAFKKATSENKAGFWDREEALATPFFDLMEEPKVGQVLDFADLVALVQRVGKQIKKKIEDGQVADEDVLSAQAIVRTVSTLSFRRIANDVTPQRDSEKGEEVYTPTLSAVA